MTTYTAIPNADIDTDSPLTQSLFTLLRDNPIAQAEGASGATRNTRGSIASGVGHRWFFDYGDESDAAETWTTAGGPYALGLWQCTTFTIAAGEVPTFGSVLGPLIICATTSITINGTLDLDGMGSRGGTGQSAATAQQGQAGMFGGSGGGGDDTSTGTSGWGGDTYMTAGGAEGSTPTDGVAQSARTINTLLALMPIFNTRFIQNSDSSIEGLDNGSEGDAAVGGGGGGGNNASASADGGPGGGLIILCAPAITVGAAGIITADGVVGGSGNAGAGGGGAIIVATPASGYTVTGGGSVAAAAGLSGGTGADGGVGWVKAVVLT